MSEIRLICTKPPEVSAPPFCGKMPDGVDCDVCAWAGNTKAKDDERDGVMCNNTVNKEQESFADLFSQLPKAYQDVIIDLMKDILDKS